MVLTKHFLEILKPRETFANFRGQDESAGPYLLHTAAKYLAKEMTDTLTSIRYVENV